MILKADRPDSFRSFASHFFVVQCLALLIGAINSSQNSALALGINYIPGGSSDLGSISCQYPLESIGNLKLYNGLLSIANRNVSIKSGSELSEMPRPILMGKVLRSQTELKNGRMEVQGVVLFDSGDYLPRLQEPGEVDTLFRNEGPLTGTIVGVTDNEVILRDRLRSMRRIDMNTVLYIRSGRVFVFSVVTDLRSAPPAMTPFNANIVSMTFKPTVVSRGMSMESIIPEESRYAKRDPLVDSEDFPGSGGKNKLPSFSGSNYPGMWDQEDTSSRFLSR